MEFYIVVLIFISCMIVLALLIYYCQERRNNTDYSINEKQCDIASIALSIGAPELLHNIQNGKSTKYSKDLAPIDFSRFYNQKMDRQFRVKNSNNYYNYYSTANEKYSSDDLSDSDTSNSEKIYFPQKTTAYSVARRMSESNNFKRINSPAVICHLADESKKSNGASDCKIIIKKELVQDDVILDETSAMVKKPVNEQRTIEDVVSNREVDEEKKENELSATEKLPDSKKEDISLNEKLLKVPSFNPNFKIKRKSNSSSSLNAVEEEKEPDVSHSFECACFYCNKTNNNYTVADSPNSVSDVDVINQPKKNNFQMSADSSQPSAIFRRVSEAAPRVEFQPYIERVPAHQSNHISYSPEYLKSFTTSEQKEIITKVYN